MTVTFGYSVVPMYVMSHFVLATFEIAVFFDFQQFNYDIVRCGALCIYHNFAH